jgi:hypothetical protein
VQQQIRRRHPEVVVDVLAGAVEDTVEERVIDVLGSHARNLRVAKLFTAGSVAGCGEDAGPRHRYVPI